MVGLLNYSLIHNNGDPFWLFEEEQGRQRGPTLVSI